MTNVPEMFTRRATGLVREAGTWSTLIYNVNFISIGLMMLFVLQLEPAFYPGGDMVGSYLLALVVVLPTSLAFGMLAAAMPRSGGDYVYVSRVLGPRLGMTSSWTNTIWWFIYGGVPSAFLARYGLGPLFRNVGLLTGNATLAEIGTWFVSPAGTIVTGVVLIAALVAVFALGLGAYFRIQNALFVVAMVGLAATGFVLLTGSPATFQANLDRLFGGSGTYGTIIDGAKAAGFALAPTDFRATLIPITWIYLELVFNQSSAYIGGEVRRASTIQLWSMPVAAIVAVGIAIVLTVLFQNAIGTEFLGAVSWDAGASLGLSSTPTFSELVSYMANSTVVALLVCGGFVFWSYTWLPGQILNASRNLLAYGLDGILPARLATVSERFHTPIVSLLVVGVLSAVALAVYATNPDFTTLVGIVAYIVSFILVSIAAILFPYRRREAWASSPVSWTVAGIPVISIVGLLSLLGALVAEWAYLNDPYSGVGVLANGLFGDDGAPTKDFVRLLFAGATVLSGWVIYELARWYRARQGVRLERAFGEIPVE